MDTKNDRQGAMDRFYDDGQRELKKRKRTGDRIRVTRACDRCKTRKIKCNGAQPCGLCSQAKAMCTFQTAYNRGRLPPVPQAVVDVDVSLSETSASVALCPGKDHATTDVATVVGSTAILASNLPAYDTADIDDSRELHRNSPEASQTDLQGHYIGPASGVSFLLRIQKRLHQAISFSHPSSSIFTFGDAPLHQPPQFDPSFCMMLPRDDARRLVDRYFDYAMPTYRFLHRPTIQEWFSEFYDTLGAMHDGTGAPVKAALLFMIFAQARVYMPDNDRPGPVDLSARYYLAAEHLLAKEKGSIRLISVQARLLQCYYLLTRSRINHCWSLFGTVTRLALAIGLNRNRNPDAASGLGLIESECRRRTFWCAYTLDAYLSLSLGRPPTFHDEDIDTELPACHDDHEMVPGHTVAPNMNKGPCIMLAPIAHMKLASIICKLLRGLYSIRPVSRSQRTVLIEKIAGDLSAWRVELSRFLDADLFSASLLMPIFQRQRNVLNSTYWHAIILMYRPFVLSNFEKLSTLQDNSTGSGDEEARQKDEYVQKCLAAAMDTVGTISEIAQSRQMIPAFWITAYYAFNATIILYIYAIQKCTSPPTAYGSYLTAAMQCQSHISRIAEKGSLSERYYLVLEELRVEALRQTRRFSQVDQAVPMPMEASPSIATDYTDLIGDRTIDFNGMPASNMFESSGWGQFASMVSSGLGNLDVLLSNDSFYPT